MSNPVYVEIEVSQSIQRDGSRGQENWNVLVYDNESSERHGVDEAQCEALRKMGDQELLLFVESLGFAQDTIYFARENNDGIYLLGKFVEWEALDAAGPRM